MNTERMPTRATISTSPPSEVSDILRRLGGNLRTARLRRRLRIQDIADRIGASRSTVTNVENGRPGVSGAAYFGVLWSLGLLADANHLADPDRDEEGKMRDSARLPTRARGRPLRDDS
ncbi:MAG: helix-turn-helix domain-containing protein [Chloroflexota bacterium]|nr:helix-turn-helix domain-containing protein [Chloroflexota bacterium]